MHYFWCYWTRFLWSRGRGWWTIMKIRNSGGTITKTKWGSLLLLFSQVWHGSSSKVLNSSRPWLVALISHFHIAAVAADEAATAAEQLDKSHNHKSKLTTVLQSNVYFLDNRISDLQRDELQGLGSSLKSLDLSGNSLTSVPEGIFWNLQRLEILKLARNNIIQIHSMAFKNGVRTTILVEEKEVFHKKMSANFSFKLCRWTHWQHLTFTIISWAKSLSSPFRPLKLCEC